MPGLFAIIVLLFGFTSYASAADQPDAVAQFYSGHAALQQGDPAEAISDFSKALEIGNLEETQVAYVHHYRAIAFQRLDRHQEAIDDYTQALAIGTLPKRVQAAIYYNRAIALDHLANFERAIRDYTQAIAHKPDYAEAYMNRGNAYRKLGDNDAALRDYQSSAAYGNPIKHLPYYGEGLVLEAKGDKQAAFKAFQTALLLAPDFEPARLKVEGYQAAGMTPSIATGTTAATARTAPTAPRAAPTAVAAASPPPSATEDMQINLRPQYPLPRTSPAGAPPPSRPIVDQVSSTPSSTQETSAKPSAPKAASAPTRVAGAPPKREPTLAKPSATAALPALAEEAPAKPRSPAAATGISAAVPAAVPSSQSGSSGGGTYLVQVGAFTSEAVANSEAAQILTKYGDLLTGLEQDVQRADLGAKGIYYRLRFGPFGSKGDANDRCTQLKSRGQACIIVAGSAG